MTGGGVEWGCLSPLLFADGVPETGAALPLTHGITVAVSSWPSGALPGFRGLRGLGCPPVAFFPVWVAAVTPEERPGTVAGCVRVALSGGLPTPGPAFGPAGSAGCRRRPSSPACRSPSRLTAP